MTVMMPVRVISKACQMCPRLKVTVQDEYIAGDGLVGREIECAHYDDCLLAIEMLEKGREDRE